MPKIMTLIGLIVSVLLVLVFGVDLAIEIPFRRAAPVMDIAIVACALVLGFLSWQTMREQI